MSELADELGGFFDFLWRDTDGWVYLPVIDKGDMTSYMFKWPERREAVISHVIKHSAQGHDTYSAPSIFKEQYVIQDGRKRAGVKENVKGSWVLWADFDSNAPESFGGRVPEPTVRVQSSVSGREHVYWGLGSFVDSIPEIENRNRSIAYTFQADTSGWDANQFLRPPGTTNSGHGKADRKSVTTARLTPYGDDHELHAFDGLPSPKELVGQSVAEPGNLPSFNEVLTLNTWTPEMLSLFEKTQAELVDGDRSKAMMSLGYQAAENKWKDGDIYVLLLAADDKWGKYVNRAGRTALLVNMLNLVRQKVGYLGGGEFDDLEAMFEEGEKRGPVENEGKVKPLYGFLDFIEAEFHVDWLYEGLISLGGWGMVTADPGTGKTQWAIQMGMKLALGEDFLRWKNMSGRKKVLFLSAEMAAAPLGEFMNKIAGGYTKQEHQILQNNFKIMPIGSALPLSDEGGQKYLDYIMQHVMPDLLIIDSLQKVVVGELTSPQEIREFNNYLAKNIRQRYGCAVFAIHHNSKGTAETRMTSRLSDAYGSTFLGADLDSSFNLRQIDPIRGIIAVDQTKARLSALQKSFEIQRTEHLTYEVTDAGATPTDDQFADGAVFITGDRESKPERPEGSGISF